jgi:hypothetical protein
VYLLYLCFKVKLLLFIEVTLVSLYFFRVLDDPSVDVDDTSVDRVPGTGSFLQQYYLNFLPSPSSSVQCVGSGFAFLSSDFRQTSKYFDC